MDRIKLENGVALELMQEGPEFRGIGAVHCGGVALRSGRRPMFVAICNPWGVRLQNFRLKACRQEGGEHLLRFEMDRMQNGAMEWQVHASRSMQCIGDWSQRPEPAEGTELLLRIRPAGRKIGGHDWTGFSYQYQYASSDIPVYFLQDRSTWELGGDAVGNTFWLRNGNFPPICTVKSREEHFSSEWYLADCVNANVFQFLPLQTHLQGFTMTSAADGVLLTWSPQLSHIRSLFEKQRGSNELVHVHEHCGDLAHHLAAAPMEVLFLPGQFDRVALANIHGDMLDLVYDTLHEQAGVRREYARPYGQIEEWTDADLELYRREGLPALAERGIREVEFANQFENNMNTWGVSNFCCNVDFKVSARVGEEAFRRLCEEAARRDVRVFMWGNTALSSLAWKFFHRCGIAKDIRFLPTEGSIGPVLDRARRPFVLNRSGAIDSDHYAPDFCVLNLRDPEIREYWLRAWGALQKRVGVSGIFWDSSFNLSGDKFDWRYHAEPGLNARATIDQNDRLGQQRPAEPPTASIETQYFAHLSLVRQMQELGYRYCSEDSGVFGLHRTGPELRWRLDNLFLWNEFISEFDPGAIRKCGAEPDEIFFRGLAYRVMWRLCWVVSRRQVSFRYHGADGPEDIPTEWHCGLYRLYDKLEPCMRRRTILPQECGVYYENGRAAVIWAFAEGEIRRKEPGETIDCVTGEVFTTEVVRLQKHHVYHLPKGAGTCLI